MLQKNPSTNANLTASYFNFYHANYGRNSNYKKILNHILRFMQTITIYFSVSSFKKDSSLHRVSNKDHVRSRKKSMKRTSSHSDSTNIERTTTR